MSSRTAALYQSVQFRLDALESTVTTIRGQRTGGRAGLRQALDLVAQYPRWVRKFLADQRSRVKNDDAFGLVVEAVGIEVVAKTKFVEEWFTEGGRYRIPLSLTEAVERHVRDLDLGKRRAVLAIGPADNFDTEPRDLFTYLFSDSEIVAELPRVSRSSPKFAMVHVPRFEGGEALWWPIVLGHELAHLVVEEEGTVADLKIASRIDWSEFPGLKRTDRARWVQLAENWAIELLCDAFAVVRFGPAGVDLSSNFSM